MAGGDQPLVSEDGQVTPIANGEIYNHRALRGEPRGARPPLRHRLRLRGRSSTPTRSTALDCVRRLNGIFAFALWDDAPRPARRRPRRSSASSRSTGAATARRIALASEIGALLAAGLVDARSSTASPLDHYLACRFVPAPRTLFEGVSKLPAASTADRRGARRRRESRAGASAPGDPLRGRLRRRARRPARRALHRRGRAPDDVRRPLRRLPLAAGSTRPPSSPRWRSAPTEPPSTFTIGFPGHGELLDERAPAAESARLIGTDHHATAMVETDFLAELAHAVPRLEEPCGIPSAPALPSSRASPPGTSRSCSPARAPTSRTAATAATRPPRCSSRARAAPRPRSPVPPPRVARALPRAARARRAAHLLGGRGDAERLLRLVEITDAPVRARPARRPRRRRRGRAPRRRRRAFWPTSPAATCSSRRSTSTRACSCPTGS